MYKLYSMYGSCSMAVHVVLNELGQEVELINVRVPEGQPKPAEYLKINPRGSVPALLDDGHLIREGAAILIYLLDKHNGNLLPKSGFERAAALEWLMFCNATLHPAYARGFYAMRNLTGDAQKNSLAATVEIINKMWHDIEFRLAENKYLAGENITVADILLTVIANWSGKFDGIKIGENAKKLLREVIARPAYQKALAVENIEYKVAA